MATFGNHTHVRHCRVPGSVSILHHHSKGIKFDMTGAILTTAGVRSPVFNAGDHRKLRDGARFPGFRAGSGNAHFLLDSDLGMRFQCSTD